MAKDQKSGLTVDEDLIRNLAALLDETSLTEIEVQEGESKVRVAKGGTVVSAPAPAPSAAAGASAPATTDETAVHPDAITAPMVGVCYLAPDPSSPAFCAVGDTVKQGETVMLIEAMKVFNPIAAPKAGTVTAIYVSDGTPVEFGEPLIVIE